MPEDDESDKIYYDTKLEKYLQRSSQLQSITYPEYYMFFFQIPKTKNNKRKREIGTKEAQINHDIYYSAEIAPKFHAMIQKLGTFPDGIYTDSSNRAWKLREKPIPVRYFLYQPVGKEKQLFYE